MRPLLATLTAFFLLTTPAAAAWTWPVAGEVITPYQNGTDPYASGQHRGIDIAARTGAPVVAAAGGEVRFAGTAGSSGLTVSIRTGDGYDTSYLHLSALAVRAGARVDAGDKVGAVGTTGTRSATEPHLHFGVRDAGSRHAYHDPLSFLPPAPAGPRAADPPPPATAPEPSPAPPAAAPAPARAPGAAPHRAPRPAPVGDRARRPAPVGRRAPRPAPVMRPATRPAPVGHQAPLRTPAGERAPRPVAAPRRAPAQHGAPHPHTPPHGTPLPAADGQGTAKSRHRPAGLPTTLSSAPRPSDHQTGGTNLGWALACAGLLLAAGVLGLAEGGRRRRERRGVRRPRVASMVHAVLRHDAHLLRQR